jgi:hypothetical protein
VLRSERLTGALLDRPTHHAQVVRPPDRTIDALALAKLALAPWWKTLSGAKMHLPS